MQNITASIQKPPGLLSSAASDLLHPLLIRMSGDTRHRDSAAFQMKEEQYIIGRQPPPGEHFHREEIGTRQHIHVSGNKVLPRGGLASLGGWSDPVAAQNVAHR